APVHYSNGDKTGIGSAGQAVHWKINPRSNPTLKRTGLIFRSRLPTGSKKLTRVGDGSSRKLPAKKMGGQTYQPPAPPLMNVRCAAAEKIFDRASYRADRIGHAVDDCVG